MHPYKSFPPRQFWQHTVAARPWGELLGDERGKFTIGPGDSVASAGSCFAQRIARVIAASGLDYTLYEAAHPLLGESAAAELGYGTYSCRYGNVYTTRQMLGLVKEALGVVPPVHRFARDAEGRVIDLQRPAINTVGFASEEEARADRAWHLQCVARMLAGCDVFIFTLGLTETWVEPASGLVYGSHPTVVLRRPYEGELEPLNLDYIDCYNDLVEILNLVRGVNRDIRLVLTVSPVALAATHQPQHVLLASSYSKAVLRAVAGRIAALLPQVDYFPSFELFNASQSFGQFLGDGLRDVSPRGVEVAMALFKRMFIEAPASHDTAAATRSPAPAAATQPARAALPAAGDVECEEVLNAFFDRERPRATQPA